MNDKLKITGALTDDDLAKDNELNGLECAFDSLIRHDCFSSNNPMRERPNEALFWDWMVVEYDGIRIPAPIHTDEDGSCLYDSMGREHKMSNEQCALTTTVFYTTHLINILDYIESNENKLHQNFVDEIKIAKPFIDANKERLLEMIDAISEELEAPARKVLD